MAEKAKEVKVAAEVSEDVLALSKTLAKGLELDKATGAGTAAPDLYTANMPEGITKDVVKAVSNYNSKFIAASAHAFGNMAVSAMAKNKSLATATVDVPMGHRDNLALTVTREKSFVNHLAGGETTVKHGVVAATYEVRAGKNGGQLKAVRAAVSEAAMAALSK